MIRRPWTYRAATTLVALATATATYSTFAVAQAADKAPAPAVDRHDPQPVNTRAHDLDGPMSKTQKAQRAEALDQVISGDAKVKSRDGSQVVQLHGRKGDSKYVELGREKTDKIFTILVEFGDKVDSRYGGTAATRCTTRSPRRTAARTTAPPGRPTTTSSTSRTSTSAPARTPSR